MVHQCNSEHLIPFYYHFVKNSYWSVTNEHTHSNYVRLICKQHTMYISCNCYCYFFLYITDMLIWTQCCRHMDSDSHSLSLWTRKLKHLFTIFQMWMIINLSYNISLTNMVNVLCHLVRAHTHCDWCDSENLAHWSHSFFLLHYLSHIQWVEEKNSISAIEIEVCNKLFFFFIRIIDIVDIYGIIVAVVVVVVTIIIITIIIIIII